MKLETREAQLTKQEQRIEQAQKEKTQIKQKEKEKLEKETQKKQEEKEKLEEEKQKKCNDYKNKDGTPKEHNCVIHGDNNTCNEYSDTGIYDCNPSDPYNPYNPEKFHEYICKIKQACLKNNNK